MYLSQAVSLPAPLRVKSDLYFYFFRLLLTLVVLPLLLSFLVRSSVALKNKMQNERQVPCCLSLHRAG